MVPVHPFVVHLPVALVVLSVVADLAGYLSGLSALTATGFWSLVGAAAGAALAVPAGLFDMHRQHIGHQAHERVHTHMKVGFVLFAALAGLTIWRWLIYAEADGPGLGYLAAAVLVLGLTAFQGWLGGDLVFSYGVGVHPAVAEDDQASTSTEGHAGH